MRGLWADLGKCRSGAEASFTAAVVQHRPQTCLALLAVALPRQAVWCEVSAARRAAMAAGLRRTFCFESLPVPAEHGGRRVSG